MQSWETIGLGLLAFVAGFVDAVVGGGGLIQMPALFVLLPPPLSSTVALVLGTNKLSSFCGTSMALAQYARRVRLNWRSILPAGIMALIFSGVGAACVTLLSSRFLKPLIFLLLVGVAIFTYARKDLGRHHAPRFAPGREQYWAMVVGAGIGFYDGFFGPGTGSFLLFIFIGVFGFDFLAATASAKVINFATNLSAVAYFAATGHILYQYAVPMAACNILGAILGSRLAMLKGNTFVRGFFLAVVSLMILRFGYDLAR
jgi:uncharacterized membrane protein YfcA